MCFCLNVFVGSHFVKFSVVIASTETLAHRLLAPGRIPVGSDAHKAVGLPSLTPQPLRHRVEKLISSAVSVCFQEE